jgi:hypothetical protein
MIFLKDKIQNTRSSMSTIETWGVKTETTTTSRLYLKTPINITNKNLKSLNKYIAILSTQLNEITKTYPKAVLPSK